MRIRTREELENAAFGKSPRKANSPFARNARSNGGREEGTHAPVAQYRRKRHCRVILSQPRIVTAPGRRGDSPASDRPVAPDRIPAKG